MISWGLQLDPQKVAKPQERRRWMRPLGRPLLLGHRGARRYAPENSIEAFDLALAHGCDGFEFDVRRTRDARGIICHDPQVQGALVVNTDYNAFDEPPPLVHDILQQYGERCFLDVEVKVPGLEEPVAALVRSDVERNYVVSSFLPEALHAMRARHPGILTGWITDSARDLRAWEKIEGEFVIPEFRLLSRDLVHELHLADRRVLTWTVNRERDMLRAAEMNVDGIISDDTLLLCRVFGADAAQSAG